MEFEELLSRCPLLRCVAIVHTPEASQWGLDCASGKINSLAP